MPTKTNKEKSKQLLMEKNIIKINDYEIETSEGPHRFLLAGILLRSLVKK